MATPIPRAAPEAPDFRTVTRPDPRLQTYYLICSLFTGPLFFIPYIPLYLKFHSLRYRFDDEGVSLSWGVLFKREIVLAYRRIQDIHVNRNLIQRWMGLATVEIQTASGNAAAEMSIEGIPQADALRDFLYARMRGVKDHAAPAEAHTPGPGPGPADEALQLLREIRDALDRAVPREGAAS
ncbi:MAG: PH domain-containing protein [Phycisphaerales bacterium]|nr:PH domain-containing protein [Phycisphaerales bacterium]